MREDNELVFLAKEKDEDASLELYKKYKPLIVSKATKVYKYLKGKGYELGDVIQECNIGFEEAIQNYCFDEVTLFYTFANMCMDRQINTLILKANRVKNQILNNALPLENDTDNDNNLLELLKSNKSNGEDVLFNDLLERELLNKIKEELTDLEENILDLRIQGFSYKEIAGILDKDIKSIDNAVQRIRTKLKNLI